MNPYADFNFFRNSAENFCLRKPMTFNPLYCKGSFMARIYGGTSCTMRNPPPVKE